jgi:hypothetical protein
MTGEPYPQYEAHPVEGGSVGWSVIITFEDGRTETRFGFRNEADTRAWIKIDILMSSRKS